MHKNKKKNNWILRAGKNLMGQTRNRFKPNICVNISKHLQQGSSKIKEPEEIF